MGKLIDLTGKTFGNLTVITRLGKKNNNYYWQCKCTCGKICEVNGSYLRNGTTKSCGCQKYKGLQKYNIIQAELNQIPEGSIYGKLTVLKNLGLKPAFKNSAKNRTWYLCECECGNICEASGNQLKNGSKISCGKCQVSRGELEIVNLLTKHNIIFNTEVVIPELLKESGRRLRFDFVIYNDEGNITRIIEFDGRQHFQEADTLLWSQADPLIERQEKDKIKNSFCKKHNIPLIRIPYWKLGSITIEDLLSQKYEI